MVLLGIKHKALGFRFLINEGSYVRVFTVCYDKRTFNAYCHVDFP